MAQGVIYEDLAYGATHGEPEDVFSDGGVRADECYCGSKFVGGGRGEVEGGGDERDGGEVGR